MVNTSIERSLKGWSPTHAKLAEMVLDTSGATNLAQRYRALFSLKGLNDDEAVRIIGAALGLKDDSDLFRHEVAYCLGQMGNSAAIPALVEAMADADSHDMVRHEAAESLGAISDPAAVPELEKYVDDPCRPLAETCVLALEKIRYDHSAEARQLDPAPADSAYESVAPAPATTATKSAAELKATLCDEGVGLWKRYRAMFALRELGTEEAVLALAAGLEGDRSSELFRHEIGFVFGEMQHPASVPALARVLANAEEAPMVRHEAAEALGSIATPEVKQILAQFVHDPEPIVSNSCVVALDMFDHETSGEFQYAIIPDANPPAQAAA